LAATLERLTRQAREAWEVPRDLLLRRYPPFVTGGDLPRGHVPVFVFHGLEPESFGRRLAYLADNDYVSLSAGEYFQVLLGARPAPQRAVLLTFDDGRGSLWSIGLPLMRRYRMKGVAFVVPGRMASRPPGPTWDEILPGGRRPPEALGRDESEAPFLSWEEAVALDRSGLIEIQSHTYLHARIHTGPRLTGFMSPDLRRGYAAMDVPLIESGGYDLLAAEVPLGTPLLESQPRTAEALRFFEVGDLGRRCVEAVTRGGGEEFFRRPDWQRTLARVASGRRIHGRFETEAEREAALRSELVRAKQAIEERTGRPVEHLCFPWHVGGPTARRLAREVGYRAAFGGKVPGVPLTLPGGDPQHVARIGEDYVELLPGRGRATLGEVLRRKWARRMAAS
jgi:peptidoglycan/xylan/chitin deacetylase (PgdA/CDA1 family)